jgi:2-phosphosulfolactate phosphatase
MKIHWSSLKEGALNATGCVLVIDVFRAFTVEAIAFSSGVEKIYLTGDEEQALRWRNQGFGKWTIGEVNGLKPRGFDFDNSPRPFLEKNVDFSGTSLIHRSSSGTSGICWASNQADTIYGVAFTNAEATVQTLLREQPKVISIIAMGAGGEIRTDEDELCAYYLRCRLQGRQPDIEAIKSLIRSGNTYKHYTHLADDSYPGDAEIALQFDTSNFAIKVETEDGKLVSKPRIAR